MNNNIRVKLIICGDPAKIKGDAKINLDILKRMDPPIEQLNPADDAISDRIVSFTTDADLIVDSLFGTGLRGPLNDEYKHLIEGMNACRCPILAVDIPSGLDCDSGKPLGASIQATWTVTFVAVKKGFTSSNASLYAGEIFVASIGVNPR